MELIALSLFAVGVGLIGYYVYLMVKPNNSKTPSSVKSEQSS